MGSGKDNTSTSTSTSTYTPAAYQQLQDIFSRAQNAANTQYQAYNGELTAGTNAQQQLGVSGINAAAGSAQPYINTAAGYATQGASTIDPSQIDKYLNPYTQSVINSTQANFNEGNAQQQQQLKGNAASMGALGGDRTGVAQAELARQQQLAQSPVIAGLNSQNYTQALAAAQADRAAAGQGAFTFGNLGTAAQSAGLQGAGAQLGAGTQLQQTQQTADTAAYQQYLQQQAFPYQQAQFLAGIGLPAAGAMGGTTTGTSTQTTPGASPWGQVFGTALTAASFLKDGGRVEGYANGGRTPFDFISDAGGYVPKISIQGAQGQQPMQQMPQQAKTGSAQDPFAPINAGLNNLRGSNAANNIGDTISGWFNGTSEGNIGGTGLEGFGGFFNNGGPVGYDNGGPVGYDGIGDDFNNRFIGESTINPFAIPINLPESKGFDQVPIKVADKPGDFDSRYSAINDPVGTRGVPIGPLASTAGFPATESPLVTQEPVDVANKPLPEDTAAAGSIPAAATPTSFSNGAVPRGIRNNNPGNIEDGAFARSQPGYIGSDGRFAKFETPEAGSAASGNLLGAYAKKGINTISGVVNRWAPATDGNDVAGYVSAVSRATGIGPNEPIDLTDPVVNQKISAAISQHENGAYGPSDSKMMATNYNRAASLGEPVGQPTPLTNTEPTKPESKGLLSSLGINLTDEQRHGLLAAGLGMMAGTSHNALTNIGTGGLQGLKAMTEAQKTKQAQQLGTRRVDLEAQRLAQQAMQHAQTFGLQQQTAKDTSEYHKGLLERGNNKMIGTTPEGLPVYQNTRTGEETIGTTKLQGKAPTGYVRNVDGSMSVIKGGPADPETISAAAKAKSSATDRPSLTESAIKRGVEQMLVGDYSIKNNLGRGKQGPANLTALENAMAEEMDKRGFTGAQRAAVNANFKAQTAAMKTAAVREANVSASVEEAKNTFPLALKASAAVPRTQFVPWNQLVQKVQAGTSNKELAQLYTATQGAITAYAQAMARTGVMTVDGRHAAEELLKTATSQETYEAVIGQMAQEMKAAEAAPETVRHALMSRISGQAPPPSELSPAASQTAPASAPTVPPVGSRQVGQVYQTPKGPAKWMGNGWQLQ